MNDSVSGLFEQDKDERRNSLNKRGEFSASDSFLFVGFSHGYINDTIVKRVASGGEQVEFQFDAPLKDSVWYDWVYYSKDSLFTWGLGDIQKAYKCNDRQYDWYVDQGNTGVYSSDNCGPSTVEMACKWTDTLYTGSAEEARSLYRSEGGWWYTNDIINYLDLHNVPNHTVIYDGSSYTRDLIDQGNILIACLNTGELRRNTNDAHRVDRFYNYADGHFFIVKGYRIVNDSTFFEVYDSNNWNMTYSDNSPKGKNRHFRDTDLSNAISKWWNYLIVVSEKEIVAKRKPFKNEVDPATVKHMWGR